MLAMLLTVISFAAGETSGYTLDSDGVTKTNIKWTLSGADKEKTVTFEIDASSSNKASTVIYGIDPITGVTAAWNAPIKNGWGQDAKIYKAVFKEGITELSGGVFALNRTVATVELPKSLVKISGDGTFQGCYGIHTVSTAGNTAEKGIIDLSGIKGFEKCKYTFDGATNSAIKTFKFSPELAGAIGHEVLKRTPATSLEIPAGVTEIVDTALTESNKLAVLTILGENTVIKSDNVFKNNTSYPAIKAKAGSKAEQFAKANGYTFINLETDEKTVGTKVTTAEPEQGGQQGGEQGGEQGGTTPPAGVGLDAFDPKAATAYGYLSHEWNGTKTVDTYWVYYRETKTLKIISNTNSAYNETGRFDMATDKKGYIAYKDEIEYIEIGPYIDKLTQRTFENCTALKEVKLGAKITQIDLNAFNGCTSLATVWQEGGERIEGRADLSKIIKINDIMKDTAIKEIVLNEKIAEIAVPLSPKAQTVYVASVNDSLIAYAKENGLNLRSLTDPNVKYDFYVPIPDGAIACGDRCSFTFDASTGTLTVHGAGAMDDIANYHGGGSKNAPWFDIKQQIKHIVITDRITAIGKYDFAQCNSLETVQIPNVKGFVILSAAFESCPSLRSVYVSGSEPIEGTFDLSPLTELSTFIFAEDYLVANVILGAEVTKIAKTAFDGNMDVNLANVYGAVGSYAETWAGENGKTFFDSAVNIPAPVTCTPPAPETTAPIEDTVPPVETSSPADDTTLPADITVEPDETDDPLFIFADETEAPADTESEGGISPVVWIVIAAVALAAAAAITVTVVKTKKKK